MKYKIYSIILLLIIIVIISPDYAIGGNKILLYRDLPYYYNPEASNERHKLDLYVREKGESLPIIVFVHGGGWSMGNKSMYPGIGEILADTGFLVAKIGYCLSPAVKHPEHVMDVARAVTWLQKNGGKYGGNPDKIYLMGHSAGGHLISLLALDHKYLKSSGGKLKSIRGVISISGVYKLDYREKFGYADGIKNLITPVFGDDINILKDASPINHLGNSAPPFLLLWSENEMFFIDIQSKMMLKKMKDAGCSVRGYEIKKRNHASIMTEFGKYDDPSFVIFKDWLKITGW